MATVAGGNVGAPGAADDRRTSATEDDPIVDAFEPLCAEAEALCLRLDPALQRLDQLCARLGVLAGRVSAAFGADRAGSERR
jgi:hypothetical protein